LLERLESPGQFSCAEGPFNFYQRTVSTQEGPNGSVAVTQTISFSLAIPWFKWIFIPPLKKYLGRLQHDAKMPPYLAPVRIDRQGSISLSAICAMVIVLGYLSTLLTQTITYAGEEFHAAVPAQNIALAAVRVEAVLAIILLAMADRIGRRRLLILTTALGCVATAAGALSPSLAWLTATQVLARGFVNAGSVLAAVFAVEEVAAGARAFALSLLAAVGALGAGICTVSLGVAQIGPGGWRVLFAGGLLGLLVIPGIARMLPESRRFLAPHAEAKLEGHGKRLWLLIATALLMQVYFGPASQDRNQYLRVYRGFSAPEISIFTVVTGVPGAIGLLAGGRAADKYGRKRVAGTSLFVGMLASVGMFLSSGWLMWLLATATTLSLAATVPSLGVYGPELFPTNLRGEANGIITIAGRVGSVIGLLAVAGLSATIGGVGKPVAILSVAPLMVAFLVVIAYPETARVELEEINPEDRINKPGQRASPETIENPRDSEGHIQDPP
jgi:MFS family permease